MNKNFVNLFSVFSFFALLVLSSCNKDVSDADALLYAEDTLEDVAIETRSGSGGCFELVFPISLEYPDGTTAEYDSRELMKESIKAWRLENTEKGKRPHLVFPIEIISSEGEIISIEDRRALRRAVRKCRRAHGKRACFHLQFPVTINFPDGTSAEASTRKELKRTARQWKKANPDTEGRPVLDFPLTIQFKDGTTQEVESREALKAIKDDCE